MTLRTPRRRISPQTRRRYKAIKGFFKRALGSLSQPDLLQITSSIAVNVTDINHKIVGLEEQLQEVCKTCRDNLREINSVRSKTPTPIETRNVISQREIPSGTILRGKETNIIYTKPDNIFKSSVQSDYAIRTNDEYNKVKSDHTMYTDFNDDRVQKLKKKKSKVNNKRNDLDVEKNYQAHNVESSHKNFVSAYSTSSFHSLDQFRKMTYSMPGFSGNVAEKKHRLKAQNSHHANKTHRKQGLNGYEEKVEHAVKNRKSRHNEKELDQDFIADIIRRQYKPVKFGRRNSDLSQFSAPVCRDREFCLTADCYQVPEEHQLCNCGGCHNRYSHHSDFNDIRSVCDARLYNVKHGTRIKHRRRQTDAYDNSDIYDLVPVKEKSSPKSRRKFFEDNMRSAYYKEVPPSPRTHRPQLNLKTRYVESDYNVELVKNSGKRNLQKHAMRHRDMDENCHRRVNRDTIIPPKNTMRQGNEVFEKHYASAEIQKRNKISNQTDALRTNSVMSINPILATEDATVPVETAFNKTQETISSDKTDKALCEIKDILQSFLLEIKKEASSHNQKSNTSNKMTESGNSAVNNANTMTNNSHSFSNFNSAHCAVAPSPYMPALPAFRNTCCYPLMPMCPMNCMQNGYAMPDPSFSHNNCVDKSNETCNTNNNSKLDANESCETDELIKEIYKFVSQSPTFCRKSSSSKEGSYSKQALRKGNKALTSRSVGGSTRICRHDAKVGTPKMNCVSKSCEAIKTSSDVYSSDTNASYSDTVLDKLSTEATQSYSESESTTEVSEVNKVKKCKFARVLNSLGLRKKIKKDIIEELSESESTVVEEVKKKPPFRQNITNYAMHGQEYHRPPPVSPHYRPEYPKDYPPPRDHDVPYWDPRWQQPMNHGSPYPQYQPGERPTAPPYSQSYESYHQVQPQVPLCLKEVEVKSIGCQSERKLSFFRKMTQKIQQPTGSTQDDNIQKNGSTQTPQMRFEKPQTKPGLFNWMNPQSKLMNAQINPQKFGYETQKKLAQGDMKMRNAMLKKMFYKKNPFSPRNLIVSTLMGKDKSSFGEPPASFRPRMFV